MKTNKTWLAMLAAVAALTAAQTIGAQSRYDVTDLGTLPGLANTHVWGGVNNQGHVAVYATNFTDPFVYTGASSFLWKGPGDIQLLPALPGATAAVAFGLNDLDQVVGASGPTPTPQAPLLGQNRAVLWEEGSAKVLNPLPGDTDSEAYAINRPGLIAGTSFNFSVDPWTKTAVYWYKGKISALPVLDGTIYPSPNAVNDWGQIVGLSLSGDLVYSRAVLWSTFPKASVMDLGTLGGDGSGAYDINECGQIVGDAQTVLGDWHPVLWNGMDIIELQIPDQDQAGYASCINNFGQIVGGSGPEGLSGSDLHKMHALLWEDGRMINLQTQIPANSGWKLRQATGINDQGQITGFGQYNGKNRVFLLTPTIAPQPNVTDSTDPNASAVDAMAAKKPPPGNVLWPAGAQVVVGQELVIGSFGSVIILKINWPIISGVDHYRVTVVRKSKGGSTVLADESPVSYTTMGGVAYHTYLVYVDSYTITVTAYASSDETAYSESITTKYTAETTRQQPY